MRSTLIHEAVVETRECAIGLSAMRVEFLSARRIEVESGALEGRQERAVLQRDGVVVDRNRVVELIGQPEPLDRAFVLNP